MNRGLFGTLVLIAIMALVFFINGCSSSCSRSGRADQEIKFANALDDTIMVCITDFTQKDCGLLMTFLPYQSRNIKRFQGSIDLKNLKYFTGLVPKDLYYIDDVNIITESMKTARK